MPVTSWDAARCAFWGAGIIGALGVYGFWQERIMSVPYVASDGVTKELFRVSLFLVLANRLCAIVFAVIMCIAGGEDMWPKVPIWKYLAISFSNVGATTCQYEALKWVSFPVQMLGKSFKMMPVMLWGIVISGKAYSLGDWMIAAAVTGGVTEFLLTGDISSPNDKSNSIYGLLLLVGFLAADGFTSTFQEKLFEEHQTSKYNQMLYINLGSAFTSCVGLLVAGQFGSALTFVNNYPLVVYDAATLSAAAVAGQFFIYSMVKDFGALVFAATMNVRQVISILVSYYSYRHQITLLQIAGLVCVFGALFYKSFSALITPKPAKDAKPKEEEQPLVENQKKEEKV